MRARSVGQSEHRSTVSEQQGHRLNAINNGPSEELAAKLESDPVAPRRGHDRLNRIVRVDLGSDMVILLVA